jgi:DNA gyrase/topoisomerase IV subunit A
LFLFISFVAPCSTKTPRRARHQLQAAAQRSHVVEGLLLAIRQIDAVIAVIRAEPSRAAAKAKLMALDPPLQVLYWALQPSYMFV